MLLDGKVKVSAAASHSVTLILGLKVLNVSSQISF